MDITEKVYKISAELPNDERFNLISQIRRCAVSIPSNIAEGSGRNSKKEFVQFLSIANGSSFELITQLMLLQRLNLIQEERIKQLIADIVEVCNMNFALQRSLSQAASQS